MDKLSVSLKRMAGIETKRPEIEYRRSEMRINNWHNFPD
jgi:hypothetical protein